METFFVCPRCGNADIRYVGYRQGQPYCRRCIAFQGSAASGGILFPHPATPVLAYALSDEQARLSAQIAVRARQGQNTFIHAVCGAGKTEIVLAAIAETLSAGKRVGFAIPRQDVVRELYTRLRDIFPAHRVIAVFGGHHAQLDADLTVLTMHQLYRYEHYFDLVVADEIDAFPFKNNPLLQSFLMRSLRGPYILMSATATRTEVARFTGAPPLCLELTTRYHHHPLPVPILKIAPLASKWVVLVIALSRFLKRKEPCFIFVPTVAGAESLFHWLRLIFANGACVHAQKANRSTLIDAFRKGRYRYLVTTAVLERGVTVPRLQVIVYQADHALYDSAALVQIAGRVGRKKEAPDGQVFFIADRKTRAMVQAVADIRTANRHVPPVL